MAGLKEPPICPNVIISGQRWKIEVVPPWDERGTMGDCCSRRRRIRISADQSSDSAVDTLFHELLHAVCVAHGGSAVSDGDGEERLVYVLAPGIIELFTANPWLLKIIEHMAAKRKAAANGR